MRSLLALLAVLLASPAAAASDHSQPGQTWDQQQSQLCQDGLAAAETRYATAPGLLAAIARAESGRPVAGMSGLQPWPWVVNADGAGVYFASKPAALAWTRLALQRGVRQLDVGCAQINLQSHPDAFASLDDAFDPAANAAYAARFLTQLRSEPGANWFTATGFYHSRTPLLAADYRERVADIAAGRAPRPGLAAPLYLRAIRQGALRVALPNGGTLRLNLARQPAARARKKLGRCQVAAVLGDYMARPARAGCAPSPAVTTAREAGFKG